MKILKTVLFTLSYVLSFVIPIALFGLVVPFTHGEIKAGLTGTGFVAICLILIITYNKIKEKIKEHIPGIVEGIIVAAFRISIWLILGIGIKKIMAFINSMIDYWWIAFIFIILGGVIYVVAKSITTADDING